MGGKGSKKIADEFCDAVHLKEDEKAIELLKKYKLKMSSLTSNTNKDRIPFIEVTKCGRLDILIYILENIVDKKKKKKKVRGKINQSILNFALIEACSGNTNRGVVRLLLDRGAKACIKDKEGNTPLINCCKKNGMYQATPELLAHKEEAAKMLILKGAKFNSVNEDGKNALITAVEGYNELLAHTLLLRGADIVDVEKWMDQKKTVENWVAGSCRARFVWDESTRYGKQYVAKLKKEFLEQFDKDGSGELEKSELLTFIATHLKVQAAGGINPIQGFECEKMPVEEIAEYLNTSFPTFVKRYTGSDKNNDGKYDWSELLPIIKRFFCDLWTKSRPKDANKTSRYVFDTDIEDELKEYVTGPLADIPLHVKKKATVINAKKVAPNTPLPDGWSELKNDKGKPYYVNNLNKRTTWVRPTKEATIDTLKENEPPLPEGWKEVFDENSKRFYYYHEVSKETTWQRPTK